MAGPSRRPLINRGKKLPELIYLPINRFFAASPRIAPKGRQDVAVGGSPWIRSKRGPGSPKGAAAASYDEETPIRLAEGRKEA